jgi:hypothetical protein
MKFILVLSAAVLALLDSNTNAIRIHDIISNDPEYNSLAEIGEGA